MLLTFSLRHVGKMEKWKAEEKFFILLYIKNWDSLFSFSLVKKTNSVFLFKKIYVSELNFRIFYGRGSSDYVWHTTFPTNIPFSAYDVQKIDQLQKIKENILATPLCRGNQLTNPDYNPPTYCIRQKTIKTIISTSHFIKRVLYSVVLRRRLLPHIPTTRLELSKKKFIEKFSFLFSIFLSQSFFSDTVWKFELNFN